MVTKKIPADLDVSTAAGSHAAAYILGGPPQHLGVVPSEIMLLVFLGA